MGHIHGLIQQLPQILRQRGGSEGLLQQRHTLVQDALMDDGILSIGGGEQNAGLRTERAHPFSEFLAALLRHDDISEQQVNTAGVVSI